MLQTYVARGKGRMAAIEDPRDPPAESVEGRERSLEASKLVCKDLRWQPRSTGGEPLTRCNQQFCPACRRLLEGTGRPAINLLKTDENGAFLEHLEHRFLEKFAERGCALCAIVFNAQLQARKMVIEGRESVPTRYDFGTFVGDPGGERYLVIKFYPITLLERGSELWPMFRPVITVTLDKLLGTELVKTSGYQKNIDDKFNDRRSSQRMSSTGSEETIAQILDWLQRCQCKNAYNDAQKTKEQRLPLRLVKVGRREAEPLLCVVDGSELPEDSKYITLSHCWGPHGPQSAGRLLQSNLDSLRVSVPPEIVPKTFADTFFIASSLGIDYVWIDSLCILQDSREDWNRNAAFMWAIYANSYLTVAATASSDPSQGLFRSRSTATLSNGIVEVGAGNEKVRAGTYCCYDEDEWRALVDKAPLNQRAWVLQERVISPRVVHFTDTQVLFECFEFKASERFAQGVPPRYGSSNARDWYPWASPSEVEPEKLLPMWQAFVQDYVHMNLTYPSDKMVAISALARQVSTLVTSSGEYLAGLWEYSLLGQLCWESLLHAARASEHRAPSWSWMSIDGPILSSFTDLESKQNATRVKAVARLLNATTDWTASPFTSVVGGHLHLSAPLLRIDTMEPQPDRPHERSRRRTSGPDAGLVEMIRSKDHPDYTGETMLSFGISQDGLPTGPNGSNIIEMDPKVGTIISHGSDDNVAVNTPPRNPKCTYMMKFGKIKLDEEIELGKLVQLKPVFLPVFCIFESTFGEWEIEILRGLILAKAEDNGPDTYRRIGVAEINEYELAEFLCTLGNQEYEDDTGNVVQQQSGSHGIAMKDLSASDRIKLDEFVPKQWTAKELPLENMPRDFLCHEIVIV